MAEVKNFLTGDTKTIPDEAICISLDRYNELIKKEAVFEAFVANTNACVSVSKFFNKEREDK